MHPAFSVIFLTTLIGAAQGLFLALFTAQSYAAFKLLPQPDAHAFYGQGSLLALVLLVAGLGASFFHLGHPERAWRAATKWRTSWLSREVIVLPAFMGVVCLYGLAHWLGWHPVLMTLPGGLPVDPSAILGVAGTLLAFALFVCTAMIYASLKFLAEWHSPLTVVNYILLGGASGFSLAAAFAAFTAPELVGFLAGWAAIITLLGFLGRAASLYRNSRLKPKSTLQTAIGIKHPTITQKTQGFMGGSFNTREFFHGSSVGALRAIKWFFLIAVFPLPLVLLASGMQGAAASLVAAFLVQYAGMLAERWFFFAQANHPQNLYYRAIA
ncbi:DmsC/YnfH family molybdoenzyme membrane anchor subunit [Sulfuritalea sp.]|uniref:dimethyl sulfoxide reductase anchor subunit family protein n=1 Tax=Sulfuritalea sp. TaxID=2480090 RepID=UPI001AC331EB|nr:DmsC/YnfH family molybdoenzyme membrane anchor subunit [Sulfuritalea sp.]MBN8473450.1 dimethyl sulfoxide reductase anchor subunit [Sulfuritalea sp.]